MFKMRGLILLCLVGFILSASLPKGNAAPPQHTGKILPFEGEGGFEAVAPTTKQYTGHILPFEGEGRFSTVAPVTQQDAGLTIPLENEGGFNSTNVTTNATTAPVERKRIQWNGTWTPIENYAGFGPPPEDEENTQVKIR